jgi:hypothetical protein
MISTKPFFLIGCVRSGTTMLRDILRMHPNLVAPEETHFYRWADPFGTDTARKWLLNNKTLVRHRTLDSVGAEEFEQMLDRAVTRKDLYRMYMQLVISRNKPQAHRWFDKTPQNVYGAAMLAADYPQSRFVHIVRNPADVVLSLREGTVMKVRNVVGACNYWRESVAIMDTLKRACPGRVFEVRYEDFTADPKLHTGRLLDFVQEPYEEGFMDAFKSRPSAYDAAAKLTPKDKRMIERICGQWAAEYGYGPEGAQKPRRPVARPRRPGARAARGPGAVRARAAG